MPNKAHNTSRFNKRTKLLATIFLASILVFLVIHVINVGPFRFFGGVAWFKRGVHYMSSTKVDAKINELNAPKEQLIASSIKQATPLCDSVASGFCQRESGIYYNKVLITPEVPYRPSTPDRHELIGFCTRCRDGSLSPSCAVGSGACSWHGGVAAYNEPQYKTIPGSPEIPGKPAEYSYTVKSYKDSPKYIAPEAPSLDAIIGIE